MTIELWALRAHSICDTTALEAQAITIPTYLESECAQKHRGRAGALQGLRTQRQRFARCQTLDLLSPSLLAARAAQLCNGFRDLVPTYPCGLAADRSIRRTNTGTTAAAMQYNASVPHVYNDKEGLAHGDVQFSRGTINRKAEQAFDKQTTTTQISQRDAEGPRH